MGERGRPWGLIVGVAMACLVTGMVVGSVAILSLQRSEPSGPAPKQTAPASDGRVFEAIALAYRTPVAEVRGTCEFLSRKLQSAGQNWTADDVASVVLDIMVCTTKSRIGPPASDTLGRIFAGIIQFSSEGKGRGAIADEMCAAILRDPG